jgi:hypothetical protein
MWKAENNSIRFRIQLGQQSRGFAPDWLAANGLTWATNDNLDGYKVEQSLFKLASFYQKLKLKEKQCLL